MKKIFLSSSLLIEFCLHCLQKVVQPMSFIEKKPHQFPLPEVILTNDRNVQIHWMIRIKATLFEKKNQAFKKTCILKDIKKKNGNKRPKLKE